VARVKGLDVDGNPTKQAGVPTLEDVEALEQEHVALTRSLGQELVEIQMTQADGTAVLKRVKLEHTVQAFTRRFEQKQAEIEKLTTQLEGVVAEITRARHEWEGDEDDAIKKAEKQRKAEKEAIMQRARKLKQQSLAEIEQAQKEDRAAATETNRKFQDFLQALQ